MKVTVTGDQHCKAIEIDAQLLKDGDVEMIQDLLLAAVNNALEASRNYNPWPKLEAIRAPLVAVNAEDDFINPPELGVMPEAMKRVKRGKYVLLKVADGAHGHGTSGETRMWGPVLREFIGER